MVMVTRMNWKNINAKTLTVTSAIKNKHKFCVISSTLHLATLLKSYSCVDSYFLAEDDLLEVATPIKKCGLDEI